MSQPELASSPERTTYLNPVTMEDKWHDDRRTRIGGSGAARVLGWDRYKPSVVSWWKEKTGRHEDDFEGNRFTRWGELHEPAILQSYAWRRGCEVLGRDRWGRPVVFQPDDRIAPMDVSGVPELFRWLNPLRSPERPFMGCNVDGFALDADRNIARGLEAKTTVCWNRKKWRGKVPMKYVAQVLHNRQVLIDLGYDIPWDFIVLVGGNDEGILKAVDYPWLRELMVEREGLFWQHVEDDEPPQKKDFSRVPHKLGEPMKVSDGGGSRDFKPILPGAGMRQAVCVDVVDRGEQEEEWNGEKKVKKKLEIVWLLDEDIPEGTYTCPASGEKIEVPEELAGKPFRASRWFTQSLHPQSNLRPFLENWRSRPFTKEELNGFEMDNLIGANALLNIVHNYHEPNDRWYANVSGANPLMKGQEKLPIPDDYVRVKDREDEEEEGDGVEDPGAPDDDDDLPF